MDSIPFLNILVVEDDYSLREMTKLLLGSHGHRVSAVRSAEEVVETHTSDLPDLYVIDVGLPGEDGVSLTRRIRASQPLAGIIITSGRGAVADRVAGYSAGADNYLVKPVEMDELLACVANLAKRIRLSRTLAVEVVLEMQGLSLRGPEASVSVSHSEAMLLAAFCRAPGQKLERWQAMQLIDTDDKGLVPANLEMRVTSLRRKLEACGAGSDAIRSIRGVGYALTCPVVLG